MYFDHFFRSPFQHLLHFAAASEIIECMYLTLAKIRSRSECSHYTPIDFGFAPKWCTHIPQVQHGTLGTRLHWVTP